MSQQILHPAWSRTRGQIEGLEPRKEQDAAFSAVFQQWDAGALHISLEADTGIGKSMIVAPLVQQGRVIYSARTKDQQRQMRDVTGPWLDRNGLLPGGMAVLMGRNNYICLERARKAKIKVGVVGDGTSPNYPDWIRDRWPDICSDSDECDDCTPADDAYKKARMAAGRASLLVVNHSLVAIDYHLSSIGVREDYLPIPDPDDATLVLDEVQELPDVLSDAFGARISVSRIQRMANRVDSPELSQIAIRWRESVRVQDGEYWIDRPLASELQKGLEIAIKEQNAAIELLERAADDDPHGAGDLADQIKEIERGIQAAGRMHGDVVLLLTHGDERVSYASGAERAAIVRKIDVATEARKLRGRYLRSLSMSATLQGLPMRRLGLPRNELIQIGSPYDMQRRRLIYVTPKEAKGAPHQWDEAELVELVEASGGGALVLATSHEQKRRAADALGLAGFRVAVQEGTTDRNRELVGKLAGGYVDVLVGTRGLATGTDIPGPALRLVVLLSWPNPNPAGDPYIRRIGELFQQAGVNPWGDHAWFGAMAGIEVHQSVGRLVRGRDDFGVVALLEPRWHKSKLNRFTYPSIVTASIDDVRNFIRSYL